MQLQTETLALTKKCVNSGVDTGGAVTGVTKHPLSVRIENYITKNITSQAILVANERV